METHIKLIGWFWIVLGVLGILGAACGLAVIAGGGLISGERDAIIATSIVATVLGGFLVAISAPGIIVGIGLLQLRSWGRIAGIILAVLNIFSFPIGTALAAYSLWVLLNEETSALFEDAS